MGGLSYVVVFVSKFVGDIRWVKCVVDGVEFFGEFIDELGSFGFGIVFLLFYSKIDLDCELLVLY